MKKYTLLDIQKYSIWSKVQHTLKTFKNTGCRPHHAWGLVTPHEMSPYSVVKSAVLSARHDANSAVAFKPLKWIEIHGV